MKLYVNNEEWTHKLNNILTRINKILEVNTQPVIKNNSMYTNLMTWKIIYKQFFII